MLRSLIANRHGDNMTSLHVVINDNLIVSSLVEP